MRITARAEALEVRRLLSRPSNLFAQAGDEYRLTIGTSVVNAPVTQVQWGMFTPAGGKAVPSDFAVTRLMMRSNLVGCSTGMSDGFVPRRILST